jgi:hypothetical protein
MRVGAKLVGLSLRTLIPAVSVTTLLRSMKRAAWAEGLEPPAYGFGGLASLAQPSGFATAARDFAREFDRTREFDWTETPTDLNPLGGAADETRTIASTRSVA